MAIGMPPPASMLTAATQTPQQLAAPESLAVTQQVDSPERAAVKGVTEMGLSIDRALDALMKAAPQGAVQFSQARDLITEGLSRFLSEYGEAVSPSPEETGNRFPSSMPGQGY